MKQSKEIQLHTEVWQEGKMYVAYALQLDLSSCGRTLPEAKRNILEAADAFLEEAKSMGTLKQVLEESGFVIQNLLRIAGINRERYFILLKGC